MSDGEQGRSRDRVIKCNRCGASWCIRIAPQFMNVETTMTGAELCNRCVAAIRKISREWFQADNQKRLPF